MRLLSPGKLRGLQRCTTAGGAMSVLALDHRNNLRRSLNPSNPGSVSFADMKQFKLEVVSPLVPHASAVLLDPEAGAAQCLAAGALPPDTGVLVAVDATGYSGEKHRRKSILLPGWNTEKVKRMGADAVKLLVYYHPDSDQARETEALVQKIAEQCSALDILFVVEPLSYSPNRNIGKLTSNEKRDVVIKTAEKLTTEGVDILKAEFPLDAGLDADENSWDQACRELSAASPVPWVLLSAGVSYETYLRQVTVACNAGASGIAAGRAVWAEAALVQGQERSDFLLGTGRTRMQRLTALCEALARPVHEQLTPEYPEENWYENY
jgi:tagatose 1,6-diphosphate aldolase